MITLESATQIALSLPGVKQLPHFDKTSFRVKNKIFATLNHKENRACVKLSEIDQSVFCSFDATVMYPVPNKWGKQGWTLINLNSIPEEMFLDALSSAHQLLAKGKWAIFYWCFSLNFWNNSATLYS